MTNVTLEQFRAGLALEKRKRNKKQSDEFYGYIKRRNAVNMCKKKGVK